MITSITKSSKKCAIFEFLASILHYYWCVYVMCVIYVLSYFSSLHSLSAWATICTNLVVIDR